MVKKNDSGFFFFLVKCAVSKGGASYLHLAPLPALH